MPGNEDHVAGAKPVAIAVSIAVAVGVAWYTKQPLYAILGLIPILTYPVFVGIPDIDSESSIPRRQLRTAIMVVSPVAVGYAVYMNWSLVSTFLIEQISILTPDNTIVAASAGVIVVGFGLAAVVDQQASERLPNHRGILHNPLFYVILGVPTIAIFNELYLVSQPRIIQLGAIILLGCAILFSLVHIGQDKIN